jgi:hypothetical protein
MRNLGRIALAAVAAVALACAESEEEDPGREPEPFKAMSSSGYRVAWGKPEIPPLVKPGATVPVTVTVTNSGDQTWVDIPNSDEGVGAVRLAYRWWKAKEDAAPLIDDDKTRADLAAPLAPGESATLTIMVKAPPSAGRYELQLELVAEMVHWFRDQGATPLFVPVVVG